MTDQSRPGSPVYLISGNSGAGKSTVGRSLAERFERGVFIEADDIGRLIVTGARPPRLEAWSTEERRFDAETERQLELRYCVLSTMAGVYVEYGFALVIDFFFVTPWVEYCLGQMPGLDVHLVTLEVPAPVRHQRILGRRTALPIPGFDHLVETALRAKRAHVGCGSMPRR
jgi:predicted kinase